MDFNHPIPGIAGPLVESIDILSDQGVKLSSALELNEREMSGVGFRGPCRRVQSRLPRRFPHFSIGNVVLNVGHLFGRRISRPNSLRPPEVRDTRVR
jgi:hypothetical protein